MQSQNLKELNSTPVRRLMWRYFWPSFIGIMAHSLYNVVDRIFIGQAVGAEALSGVSAVFPIMIIMAAFGMLIGVGASAQISLSLGRKDMETARRIVGNAVVLVFIVSVVVTSVGFMIKTPMLRLFGASDATMGYANDYLNIILWGVLVNQFGFSMNAIIRAEGNARIAMYSMLISSGMNIPLDAFFIFYLDMGVKGAAIATIISMSVLCVWVLVHFHSKRCVVPLQWRYIRIQPPIVLAIVSIGVAPFLMQMANSMVQGLFNYNLIKYGNDLAVGAMGIIMSVTFLIITCFIALNMAAQPIIGYNFGAKNFARVKETLKTALIAATLVSTVSWAIIHAVPEIIVGAFIRDDAELTAFAVQGMHIFLIMLPVIGFQVVAGNYFQSTGKASVAVFLTLLRQVIVLIPMLLILPPILGLKGVWIAGPISDTVAAVICGVFLAVEWKHISAQASPVHK
jgi:putative MATE family efflux protein